MDQRDWLLAWIGGFAGLVGFVIYAFAPLEDLLPINQALLAVLCTLTVILGLVVVIQRWGRRPY
ncbi:hypothetical protein [Methylobacterium crusticola]|uniref:hypothetical protein n=1 Tax=Methylobacterium crusticola TaxID=1697972 RepID=UPI000FFC0265|nr:hypothetical protein [Methylobacterium crusticola]